MQFKPLMVQCRQAKNLFIDAHIESEMFQSDLLTVV